MGEYIKLYQYQIEHEGGARVGPVWMHRSEAKTFLVEHVQPEHKKDKFRIRRFWIKDLKHKFRAVKPELVK